VKRVILLIAVVLATTAGTARAAGTVFAVVADEAAPAAAAPAPAAVPGTFYSAVPSAALPNTPGTIAAAGFQGGAQQLSYEQLMGIWQSAGAAYGIPWQVLGAINKVESNFGRNMGPSSAGAVGWMQFMPSTWERWGVDANADGVADPWNAQDAIYSAARYLAASGGQTDISRAIFSYNHAQWYVDEVLGLARVFGDLGADATFSLDRLGVQVEQAQQEVAQANAKLVAATRVEERRANVEERLALRTEATTLLSDRLTLQMRTAQAGMRHERASATVAALRAQLAAATATLEQARTSSSSAAFAPSAAALTGAPAVQGDYVFPVGGGASIVSVGHTHHDYPAADIAAPEGSPLYALSNGIVVQALRVPTGNCGIGLTMQTQDGLSWTYCHMSYLEPAVVDGAALAVGQPVGLVGHTGHATGPHLHLQLQPATSYPQNMAWFRGFAGTAFHWNDAPTPQAAPLFSVVPDDAPASVITFTAPPGSTSG
jgi:murein DD-endopeptidase MepM/ murein hydrolase activator NlpD